MANKVITINAREENTAKKKLEVYRDVSMSAKDNINTASYAIDKSVNVKAVQNSLRNIFTWIPGERVLDPEFGNKLYRYLYNGITTYNVEQIVAEIKKVVLKYEPRVNVVEVVDTSTIDDTENNTVQLQIVYTIPTLSDEQYRYSFTYQHTDM